MPSSSSVEVEVEVEFKVGVEVEVGVGVGVEVGVEVEVEDDATLSFRHSLDGVQILFRWVGGFIVAIFARAFDSFVHCLLVLF